jgi:hypothetical protein
VDGLLFLPARRLGRQGVLRPRQTARFDLPGELDNHVEASGDRRFGDRLRKALLDHVSRALIAQRLPTARANQVDLARSRIVQTPIFVDRRAFLGFAIGFRFRRREA